MRSPFRADANELVVDCVFAERGEDGRQLGTCTLPTGDVVDVVVGDEQGGSADGVRVFAGLRWDPFILDAPAALKTIATGQLAFTDAGSIYLDGKNVLGLVVELDCERFLGGAGLVGVVAETRTRGSLSVRIERVGRPEIKNLMLGPKQFDQVNRDLEIRDLYNMEDAFELGESYQGAYRARLNANLAFWDGLDGTVDWPLDGDGAHPLTELLLADYLVVDATKPYVEHGSFLEPELAALRGAEHETCGGRTLNDDVMDRLFTLRRQRRERAPHPRWRGRVDETVVAGLPLSGRAEPGPAEAPTAPRPLGGTTVTTVPPTTPPTLELDDIQSGALHERPSPYVGTYLLLRIDDPAAGRALVRRLHPLVETGRMSDEPAARGLAHCRLHLPRAACARRAAGVAGQLRAGVPPGHGRARRPARRCRRERPRRTGRSPSAPRTSTSPSHSWRRTWSTSNGCASERAARRTTSPGVEVIWRQECYQLPTGRTSFGFKDGIGQPAVEGSGRPPTNSHERPLKAGEIILGYPDETGELPPMPMPDVLGRNGTYIVFRKLHTRVAAYRQYLREKATSREDEALLGAKMVGRWQSGAPLALAPERDDPETRRRPGAEQRLHLRRRPARVQVPRRIPRTTGESPRRARRSTAASTLVCTA